MKIGEGFNGRVAKSGQPMIVDDAPGAPRLSRIAVKAEGLRTQLIVPLTAKDKVLGTLCIAMRSERQFLLEELELLTAIGNQIGIAVENASLCQQLRVSEQNYRDLFQNASDAIWVHDLKGNIQTANRACERLTGYKCEELVGINVREFLPEGSLNVAKEIRNKLLHGEVIEGRYEQQLIRRMGER